MFRSLITGLSALLAVTTPVAASLSTYHFTFSGSAYDGLPNAAVATGSITFDLDLLTNPGRNLYDPTDSLQGDYGTPTPDLVTALTVRVTGSTNGNGTFTLNDFDAVLFDTSLLPLDLTRELVGQATASLNGKTWGQCGLAMSRSLVGASPTWVVVSREPSIEPCGTHGNGRVDV